jgi:pyochelin biosynthetic protein PchC
MTPSEIQIDPWFRRYHPAPDAAARLVYFPHAGGSASACHQLSGALAPRIEVLAVQYPGRQDRFGEPCVETVEQFAAQIHRALDRLDGLHDKPTVFFGHSMGAVIAYEVARRLETAQSRAMLSQMAPTQAAVAQTMPASPDRPRTPPPVRLFVSGRRAPSIARDERVHLAGDEGLIAELHGLAGTDPRLLADEGVLEIILPPLRADYRAIETYVWTPGPPLACPITAVIGDRDPEVNRDEAAVWQRHTTGEFALRVLPGDHFYLGEGALGVADLLRAELTVRV